MKQKLLYLLTILAIAGFVLPQQVMAETYYVKQGGTGTGEESWDNSTDLAEALKKADSGDVIWVAAGTYVPKYIADNGDNDRDKAFVIPAGVKVYGGFPADGGTVAERNWEVNRTILSGDIDGNDSPGDLTTNKTDNCYHVVIMALEDNEKATLDGFTITGGVTDTNFTSIKVNELTVSRCYGGGIYASGQALVTNNTISGNIASGSQGAGGGVYATDSSQVTSNTISGNTGHHGGGVNASGSSQVTSNTISGNESTSYGGGVYAGGSSQVTNNTISGNTVKAYGGGIYAVDLSQVTNNTITGNKSKDDWGGDGAHANGKAVLTNNIIWGNINGTAKSGEPRDVYTALPENFKGSIEYNLIGGKLPVNYDLTKKNNLIDEDIDPLFVNAAGGDYRLLTGSPAIGKGKDGVDMGSYPYMKVNKDGIVYVDAHVEGGKGDGTSWENAMKDLSEALIPDAVERKIQQIHVATGTYKPKYKAGYATAARDLAFVIPAGVKVYGGFPTGGGTMDERDWVAYPTTLSGEIGEAGMSDNCYHVVIMALKPATEEPETEAETATLDGFTITGGYADGEKPLIKVNGQDVSRNLGAGVWANGKALLTNSTITGNEASKGGAVYANGSASLTNNTITGNEASEGGGVYANGSASLTNNTITGNTAENGGGVYAEGSASLTNNILWGNTDTEDLSVTSADVTLSHNLIGGEPVLPGDYALSSDNLTGDPLFVDAAGGDYSLQPGSPCVNTGDKEVYLSAMELDDFEDALDGAGNARLYGNQIDMGAYECQSDAPTQGGTYTLTLDIASGINLYGITAGTHQIADGDHLFLQFLPEDPTLKAEDVMLLIDGVDTPFTVPAGNTYYGYILPVTGEHSIVIALREYTVTLPEVQGITYDVGAGMHNVAYGNSFTFSLTLADEINPADVHVFANGQEIQPDALRSTLLTYTIDRVTTAVTVLIEGGSTTSNASLTDGVRLAITNEELRITNESSTAVDVAIYTITGKTFVQLRGLRGSKTIDLPAGVYIVRAGQQTWKIFVN